MRFLKYIFCALLFVTASVAETININWINGDETYAQTTCEIGGDIILPETPTKRGYTFVGWSAGYVPLEYIESSGTQYIDTGITPNVDAKNTVYEYGSVFERTGGTLDGAVGGIRNASASAQTFKFPNTVSNKVENQSVYGQTTAFLRSTGKHTYKVIAKDTSQTYTLDEDVIVGSGSAPSNVTFNNETITVFAFKLSTGVVQWYFTGKIYSIYYKENEQYKFNLIPAKRNSDNVVGMYDTVSKTFFTNAGTGTFTAGPVAENQNFYE